ADEPVLGLRRLEPDVGDVDGARVEAAGRDGEPDLAAVEGDGGGRADGDPRRLAGGRVHARGEVDREDGDAGRVHRLDQRRGVRSGRAREARAEERVDDDV